LNTANKTLLQSLASDCCFITTVKTSASWNLCVTVILC